VGLFLLADTLRRGGFVPKRWWGALLLGAGGFQLYDGTIQHKLLSCIRSVTTSRSGPTT